MNRSFQLVLGLCLALIAARVSGQTVFGTTKTNLVTVDVTTGTTTNVGALGLPADTSFVTLTWHPVEQKLYGLAFTVVGSVVTNHTLTRVDPATGGTTVIATFGSLADNLIYEGLTYVPSLGTFVASRSQATNDSLTPNLVTMSTAGVAAALVTTSPALDNDTLVYDGLHSVLYTIDPNGANLLRTINLLTGASSDVGAGISTIGSLAYSPFTNRLYGTSYSVSDHSLYVIDPSNAGLITTLTTSGDQLTALAVAIPEPASWASFVGIAGLAVVVIRRRVRGPAAARRTLG